MRANCCPLHGLERTTPSPHYTHQSRIQSSPQLKTFQPDQGVRSVIVVDFRDEVYAPIAHLLKHHGLITYRAENASELAGKLVRESPDLVLLNGTQPDENAWLTSAKLRIVDASRSVWIYSPEPPSALDEWLSMARTDDLIVYGGVLHRLLDLLQERLSPVDVSSHRMPDDGQHRTVA